MNRLLLLSHDELLILWDALMRHRLALDPGDPEWEDMLQLLHRIGDLMSNNLDKVIVLS